MAEQSNLQHQSEVDAARLQAELREIGAPTPCAGANPFNAGVSISSKQLFEVTYCASCGSQNVVGRPTCRRCGELFAEGVANNGAAVVSNPAPTWYDESSDRAFA